jgi:hypothetical protein
MKVLFGKHEQMDHPGYRCLDVASGCEDVSRILLVQSVVQHWAVVNTVMNFRVLYRVSECRLALLLLTSRKEFCSMLLVGHWLVIVDRVNERSHHDLHFSFNRSLLQRDLIQIQFF